MVLYSFFRAQADQDLRGKIEEPGQIEWHKYDLVQQGAVFYGQISAAGHLQANHRVTEQEQHKADAQQFVASEVGEGGNDVHDQICIITQRNQRQRIGCILQDDHCDSQGNDRQTDANDQQGIGSYLPVQADGVEALRRQEEHHSPKPLDGGPDHQTKVGHDGAGQTGDQKFIALFDMDQRMNKTNYNGGKTAVDQ